MNDYKDKIVYI